MPRMPSNVPPSLRGLLAEFNGFQERGENTDGLQMARGAVPSLDEPFPEYTFRWGVVREEGSGSGGTTGSSASSPGNPINSMGAPHAWDEIERDDTLAGEYQLKVNGIQGELPDYTRDSNDAINRLKNTAWNLSGELLDPGTVFLAMMVAPGEWWMVWSGAAGGSGNGGYTITCNDGTSYPVTFGSRTITIGNPI